MLEPVSVDHVYQFYYPRVCFHLEVSTSIFTWKVTKAINIERGEPITHLMCIAHLLDKPISTEELKREITKFIRKTYGKSDQTDIRMFKFASIT